MNAIPLLDIKHNNSERPNRNFVGKLFPLNAILEIATKQCKTCKIDHFDISVSRAGTGQKIWSCANATMVGGRICGTAVFNNSDYRFEIFWRRKHGSGKENFFCGIISEIIKRPGGGEELGVPGTWEAEEHTGGGCGTED